MQRSTDDETESKQAEEVEAYLSRGDAAWDKTGNGPLDETADFSNVSENDDSIHLKEAIDLLVGCASQKNDSIGELSATPHVEGFVCHQVLGRGGMGVVYSATQEGLERRVAIKFLNESLASNDRAIQRFHLETQAAARLQHPSIVPVYSSGVSGDRPYYCMQLIEGIDLAEKIRSCDEHFGPGLDASKQSAQWILDVGIKISEALHHAHQSYVLHRDVKPANIMVDDSGHPWITDFGLARLRGSELTGTSELLGSLRYMSPEQIGSHRLDNSEVQPDESTEKDSRAAADHRTDLYSLAVTLIELLTRKPFIDSQSPAEIVTRIVKGQTPRLRSDFPHVSRDLETVLLKAIERDPADRYASLEHFATDLRAVRDDQPISARRIGLAGRIQRWSRRNPRVAWTAVCLAIALFSLGTLSSLQIAKRIASDNLKIRRQYASLLDSNGLSALEKGAIDESREYFEQVLDVTPDPSELALQSRRLGWLEQQELKPGPSVRFPGLVKAVSDSSPEGNRFAVVEPNRPEVVELWEADWNDLSVAPSSTHVTLKYSLPVRMCRFAPRSQTLAILAGDRTNENQQIHLVDTNSGKALISPLEFARRVVWMSFTLDGTFLLTAGWDGDICKWNVATGKLEKRIVFESESSPVDWVYSAAINPSRSLVALALSSSKLRVIDIEEMEEVWQQPGDLGDWHTDVLRISADSKFVISGMVDGRVSVWELETGRCIVEQMNLGSAVVSADISVERNQAAVTAADRTTHIIDLRTGERVGKTLPHSFPVTSTRYDSTGRWLTFSGGDQFQTWSAGSQRPSSPAVKTRGVSVASLTSSGNVSTSQRTYRITAVVDGLTVYSQWKQSDWERSTITLPWQADSLLLSATSSRLIAAQKTAGGQDRLYLTEKSIVDSPFTHTSPIFELSRIDKILQAADANTVMVAGADQQGQAVVHIVDEAIGRVRQEISSGETHVQIDPQGRMFAVGGFGKKVSVYKNTLKQNRSDLLVELRHDAWTTDACFLSNGQIATGCWDGKVRIWDLTEGIETKPRYELDHQNVVEKLVVKNRLLVVGTWSGEVGFYRIGIETDEEPETLSKSKLHRGTVHSISISEDGKRVVSGGSDAYARLWDQSGKLINELRHESPVIWCEFSGDTLATLSAGGEVRLWDAETGRALSSAIRGPSSIRGACWHKDFLVVYGCIGAESDAGERIEQSQRGNAEDRKVWQAFLRIPVQLQLPN